MMQEGSLAARIDALLPQTQCRQCGYTGCLPYAHAIANGHAKINRCPPGGEPVLRELAFLLDTPAIALDVACGTPGPRVRAVIDEANCIGCTLCIQACPVDAIVGAAKLMHTVLADHCTGCELCVPPCPVDCIDLVTIAAANFDPAFSQASKRRYLARNARLQRANTDRAPHLQKAESPAARKQRIVAAAIATARARKPAP